MKRNDRRLLASLWIAGAMSVAAAQNVTGRLPTAQQWAGLAKLPDWSGTWAPAIRLQNEEITKNPTPWTPKAAARIEAMWAQERAGRSQGGLFVNCLPEGMPTWMMITHNSFEVLFTPGRVTILGESDSNRLRRIYTDGRPQPEDPDLSFHGHSIGHWEGATLVVDTVGILPQAYIAMTWRSQLPTCSAGRGRLRGFTTASGPRNTTLEKEFACRAISFQTWMATAMQFSFRFPLSHS